jgi:hypothetical protein
MNSYYLIFVIVSGLSALIVLIPIAISMHKYKTGWGRKIPQPPIKQKKNK